MLFAIFFNLSNDKQGLKKFGVRRSFRLPMKLPETCLKRHMIANLPLSDLNSLDRFLFLALTHSRWPLINLSQSLFSLKTKLGLYPSNGTNISASVQ